MQKINFKTVRKALLDEGEYELAAKVEKILANKKPYKISNGNEDTIIEDMLEDEKDGHLVAATAKIKKALVEAGFAEETIENMPMHELAEEYEILLSWKKSKKNGPASTPVKEFFSRYSSIAKLMKKVSSLQGEAKEEAVALVQGINTKMMKLHNILVKE